MECSDLGRIVAAHDYVWEGWWPTLIGLTLDQTHQTVVGSFPSVFVTVTHLGV